MLYRLAVCVHLDFQHEREVVVQFLIGDVHSDQLGHNISVSEAFHDLDVPEERIDAFLVFRQAEHSLADSFVRCSVWLHKVHEDVEVGLSFFSLLELLLLDEKDLGSDGLLSLNRHLDPECISGAREPGLDDGEGSEKTLSDIMPRLGH